MAGLPHQPSVAGSNLPLPLLQLLPGIHQLLYGLPRPHLALHLPAPTRQLFSDVQVCVPPRVTPHALTINLMSGQAKQDHIALRKLVKISKKCSSACFPMYIHSTQSVLWKHVSNALTYGCSCGIHSDVLHFAGRPIIIDPFGRACPCINFLAYKYTCPLISA